jgi:hypothetical protein
MQQDPLAQEIHAQAPRAVQDVIAALPTLAPQAQMALAILLMDAVHALESPDEGRRACSREHLMDILAQFPGLVEEVTA